MSKICAIVLAAGESKRMGAIKQLARSGDKTLLEAVLDNLRTSQVNEIVVVLGSAADEIQRQVRLDGVRVVMNPAFQEGMGTSLQAGVAALPADAEATLVVLADQPFVQPETINTLIESYRLQRPHIVIPVFRGFRGNPVLLDRSVFPELQVLAGDVGCRAIFGTHTANILKVNVGDAGVLLDIDTQADLEKLKDGPHWDLADLEGRRVGQPELVVVGEDAVARALARFGSQLDFTVTMVDPFLKASEVAGADRVMNALDLGQVPVPEDSYVIVASRGRFDEEAIEQALAADIAYVGLIANKKRAREVVQSLQGRGIPDEILARLRAPAGLPIGARSPQEIALSVMAEIVAERAKKRAPALAAGPGRTP